MQTHTTYIGIQPFGVLIDDSAELRKLAEQAREVKGLPFEQKVQRVKQLTLDAMVNAYEQWKANPDAGKREFFKAVVFNKHPLSYALQNRAGCCRYQGALFFTLAYEAEIGDRHFIQQAPLDLNQGAFGVKSVFNDVLEGNTLHHISIFRDSLQDKKFDYSVQNPEIFSCAIGFPFPKENPSERIDPCQNQHYSYHRTNSGLVIASEKARHVIRLK